MNKPRILLGKKARNARREISHEEISEALSRFKKNGGCIALLPPQPTRISRLAGARWEGPYENVVER